LFPRDRLRGSPAWWTTGVAEEVAGWKRRDICRLGSVRSSGMGGKRAPVCHQRYLGGA